MESIRLTWQSQRKKRIGAVLLFCFILLMLVFSSCRIQPRYHQRGWQVSFPNTHSVKATKSPNPKHRSEKKTQVTSCAIDVDDDSSAFSQMHIPQSLIELGENVKWSHPKLFNEQISKQLSTFTLVGDTFKYTGHLVAANENGVFIHNPYPPLFWIGRGHYGKGQTGIRNQVLYMPYSQINVIKKGGTVSSRLERLLEKLMKIFFWGATAVFSILGFAISVNLWDFDSFEAIVLLAAIAGAIAAAVLIIIFSIILFPLLFLLQLMVSRLPGRFWIIGKNTDSGKSFFQFLKDRHGRYRLFRSDLGVQDTKE